MNRILAIACLFLAACSAQKSPEMKIGPDDWATTGGDAGKSHHSMLADINAANVGTLGLGRRSSAPIAYWRPRPS
jgi:quinohemoprotein ethanol dehydrogenase